MPAWPANVSRLVLAGTLPRNDTWSMSVHLYDSGFDIGGNSGDYVEVLGNIADLATIWFTSGQARISSSARLTSVKLNQIGPDGKYKNPYTNEELIGSGQGVAGGVPSVQWQHFSACITHRTGIKRGAAAAGRVFPPAVLLSPGAGGVAQDSDITPMADVWRNFLQGVYEAVPGEIAGMPVIVSTGTKAAPNTPTMRPITRVEIGNVIDVQNRRRNALPEKYVPATAPLDIVGGGVIGPVPPVGGGTVTP